MGLRSFFSYGQFFHTAETLKDHFGFKKGEHERMVPLKVEKSAQQENDQQGALPNHEIKYGSATFRKDENEAHVVFFMPTLDLATEEMTEDQKKELEDKAFMCDLSYKKKERFSPEFTLHAVTMNGHQYEMKNDSYFDELLQEELKRVEKFMTKLLNPKNEDGPSIPSSEELFDLHVGLADIYSSYHLLESLIRTHPLHQDDESRKKSRAFTEELLISQQPEPKEA